jgi:hypothetical protein
MTDKEYLLVSEYLIGVLRTVVFSLPLPKKPDEISFESVYSLARHHSLASTVYAVLEPELLSSAPKSLVEVWKRERDIDYVKNVKQVAAFSEITGQKLRRTQWISCLPMRLVWDTAILMTCRTEVLHVSMSCLTGGIPHITCTVMYTWSTG